MMFTQTQVAVLVAAALSSSLAMAADDVNELQEVEVWSDPFAQKMGTQKVDADTISKTATGNGTVSELLKNNPNVQLASNSSLSEAQGEIAPENVSFHGERFYNNSWMIDGMSNNDNINPGANNGSRSVNSGQSPYALPDGGTQSFWLNADLLDSVEVYDSNISARYGQFTGGVVDAKLKSPDTTEAYGSVSYRMTSDSLTNFHFESQADEDEFGEAEFLYHQPQFTKHIYSVNVNQPLSDNTALLFSYNRTESEIPFHHAKLVPDLWEDQDRLAETFLLKGLHEADNGDLWELTAIAAPHSSGYVSANVKDGGYDITGGGHQLTLSWAHFFDTGSVTSYLGYNDTENGVDYDGSDSITWIITDSIDWESSTGSAVQGGYGETVTNKQTITAKQDYQFDGFAMGAWQHKLSFGWKADFASAEYQRKNDTSIYVSSGNSVPSQCLPSDFTCIPGEQAADIQLKYLKGDVSVSNDHHAIYAQDQIQFGQWELTAGVRLDYDELLENVDVAPRFTASYDLFADGNTVLFGGANRYYADSLLAYALSDKKGDAERYSRDNYNDGWQLDSSGNIGGTYLSTDLDTPYSDELNLGVHLRIGNSEWTFKWVNRQGKQQFNKEENSDDNSQYLSNNGSSESNSVTLSGRLLKPLMWGQSEIDINLGANYLDSESDFTSYDPSHELADTYRAYADGQIITYDELYAKLDFNIPWTLFTTINVEFAELGINWNQRYNYSGGYSAYEQSGDSYICSSNDPICGGFSGNAIGYEEVSYDARFSADWRFNYTLPIGSTELALNLDVLNVFDAKIAAQGVDSGTSNISYKPGRQFWLGAQFHW
ncbi:TonB-dependent receptor plug domain-containing protein [uncultured Ferrimonas sp.]|uniref:TonB-dependent receptor plug domain-containing protein n=1 Tax=uncultured Ferrimonas sp. TaxID=432640 RepID=UPI0026259997|nr:TonB-dependent receptor plug domain-containing protein [uncultured Ferrimonas sp.]